MHDRILEEASRLFLRNGVRSITMNEIAEALGMSKRTLYEHFPNKEVLLQESIKHNHNKYVESIKKLLDTLENPLEIIHIHITEVFKVISNAHPNFINDLNKYHPEICKKVVIPNRTAAISFTEEVIKRGVKQGYFREDINPSIMANIAHLQFQLMDDSAFDNYSKTDVFEHTVMTFIRGIATEKGHKMIDKLFYNEK